MVKISFIIMNEISFIFVETLTNIFSTIVAMPKSNENNVVTGQEAQQEKISLKSETNIVREKPK